MKGKERNNLLLNKTEDLIARIAQLARRMLRRLKISVLEAIERAMARIRAGMTARERHMLATLALVPQVEARLAMATVPAVVGRSLRPQTIKINPHPRRR